MGIWEELRSVADRLIKRKSSDKHHAVTKTVNAVETKEADQLTEASHRENITRILTNIGKFAVDETIKGVSGGIQVNKIAKELHVSDESKKSVFLTIEEIPGHGVLTQCENNVMEPLSELSDEPCEVQVPIEASKKRIFIRSRL